MANEYVRSSAEPTPRTCHLIHLDLRVCGVPERCDGRELALRISLYLDKPNRVGMTDTFLA